MRTAVRIIWQAAAIAAAALLIAIATNAARPDGIPLVAQVEYDIFSQCEDSSAKAQAATSAELGAGQAGVLYVDARPAEAFAVGHAKGAVNAPYSVLFGAAPEAIAAVKAEIAKAGAKEVVVYGEIADPSAGGSTADLARPLADQLLENGVTGVKHVPGGLEALKKNGVDVVQGTGGAR
jgi:rhodanese-related sulfurtransferase